MYNIYTVYMCIDLYRGLHSCHDFYVQFLPTSDPHRDGASVSSPGSSFFASPRPGAGHIGTEPYTKRVSEGECWKVVVLLMSLGTMRKYQVLIGTQLVVTRWFGCVGLFDRVFG